jgi:hypothetical protein
MNGAMLDLDQDLENVTPLGSAAVAVETSNETYAVSASGNYAVSTTGERAIADA